MVCEVQPTGLNYTFGAWPQRLRRLGDSTHFLGSFFSGKGGGRRDRSRIFSETGKPNYTTFWENIELSSAFTEFVPHFR